MTKNKYNGPRLHLGLIEEAKAAFIDFMPAGIVIFSALLINIFLICKLMLSIETSKSSAISF